MKEVRNPKVEGRKKAELRIPKSERAQPLEGVVLLLGLDQLLDMGRTTINLVGNCLATFVMARWEGEFE